ncbi:hypothetical protein BH23ACT10_BH23ACT10_11490 [soil metagenome]
MSPAAEDVRRLLGRAVTPGPRPRLVQPPGSAPGHVATSADLPAIRDLLRMRAAHSDAVPSVDDRLDALRTLSGAVDPRGGFRDLVGLLADEACDIVGAASLSLARWERDEQLMRVMVNVGRVELTRERFPDDEVLAMADHITASRKLAAGKTRSYILAEKDSDPAVRVLLEKMGRGSCAAVPVHVADRLWGELYVTTEAGEPPFAARDLELLTTVAGILGGALAHGEQMDRMARLAFEDPLTGLANRRAVDDRLARVLRTSEEPITVIMLDVNGLKHINDEFGHAAGDRALCAVADALSVATVEEPDASSARLGGDEFCVVLVGDEEGAVERVIERTADQLRQAPAPQVTISAGAATSTGVGRAVRALFTAADKAQYEAKRSGCRLLFVDVLGSRPAPSEDGARQRRRPTDTVDADGSVVEIVSGRVIEALRGLETSPVADVLETVADVIAEACDLSRWSFSRIDDDGGIRTQRLRLRRTRPASRHCNVVPPEDEFYLLDDYPLTRAAIEERVPFWIAVDREDHDPDERSVLQSEGMGEVIGFGGYDREGAWLLELYADEHSDSLKPYVTLARVLSLALRDAD